MARFAAFFCSPGALPPYGPLPVCFRLCAPERWGGRIFPSPLPPRRCPSPLPLAATPCCCLLPLSLAAVSCRCPLPLPLAVASRRCPLLLSLAVASCCCLLLLPLAVVLRRCLLLFSLAAVLRSALCRRSRRVSRSWPSRRAPVDDLPVLRGEFSLLAVSVRHFYFQNGALPKPFVRPFPFPLPRL